jgi:signal transduction histidine kinase/CHASE1-domain containing sensor protein
MVVPLLVLAFGVVSSFALYRSAQNSVERVARLRFEREANDANAIIEGHLRSYCDVLYSLRALFADEETVDRLRFHNFVAALDLKNRYPGFVSINYAALVFARDKSRFEESVRRDLSLNGKGYPDFSIKPPGERPEYYVAVYLEPMEGFEFGFGLDIGANPMADDPVKVASTVRSQRDSGKLIASGQPLRVKRGREAVYLAMRLPVYKNGMMIDTVAQRRSAYIGSVGAAFDVGFLMKGAIPEDTLRHMRVRLYDVGPAPDNPDPLSASGKRLLFDSDRLTTASRTKAFEDGSLFVHDVPVELAGRMWNFEYSVPASVVSETDRIWPQLIFGGGILSSVLLFGILYALASSRSRAIEIADEITRDLRESEAGLAEAQRMARLGNWALDPVTRRMNGSEETWRILGFHSAPADFDYRQFLQRVHEEDRAHVDATLLRSIETGQDCEIDHRVQTDPNTVRWMHTVLHPGRRDARGRLPGTIMDITLRRLAQDELRASAEQLQALSRRLVDAQEAERRRFSRELHDLVGQNLTALSINLDILKSQLGQGMPEDLRRRIGDSESLLDSTTAAIENVMSELRPPMLDDYGLLPALQWYAGDFAARTGVELKIDGEEHMARLSPEAEIALFRIAQEALNNVAKHAHAKRTEIRLERVNAHTIMTISDDGVGFESAGGARARRRPGLGMVTMRERTQAIGGTFDMEAKAGGGMRITVTVPDLT